MIPSWNFGARKTNQAAKGRSIFGLAALAAISLAGVSNSRAWADGYAYTPINVPGATGGTFIQGINGTTVIGDYVDANGTHGFTYGNGIYTTFDAPGSTGNTTPGGMSGSTLSGWFQNATGIHGFTSTGGIYTAFDYPGASSTYAEGISGSTVIGGYTNSSGTHGFTYNGTTFTSIPDDPNATSGASSVYGIDGSVLVGNYANGSGHHGFTYSGGVFSSPLDDPNATSGTTWALGISGSSVVGCIDTTNLFASQLTNGTQGFIETNGVYTPLVVPGSLATCARNISGTTVVGWYTDASGSHGFVATPVPEPASLALVGMGAALLIRRRGHKR